MQIVSFWLERGLYGLPILLVKEFFRQVAITPVPLADSRIEGITDIRGQTAVVVDLCKCLVADLTPTKNRYNYLFLPARDELSENAMDIADDTYDEPIVLRVDRIYKVSTVDEVDIKPPPAHINSRYVPGVFKVDDEFIAMISPKRLVTDVLQGVKHHSALARPQS